MGLQRLRITSSAKKAIKEFEGLEYKPSGKTTTPVDDHELDKIRYYFGLMFKKAREVGAQRPTHK